MRGVDKDVDKRAKDNRTKEGPECTLVNRRECALSCPSVSQREGSASLVAWGSFSSDSLARLALAVFVFLSELVK